jgi:serine/threonine protein kinase
MLDRTVALKILPPEVGKDPAFAERFTREAQALAKLTHPNIVMIFDFGETDGYYYFVMEYVDGINLRQSLQLGRVSPEEALAIIPQICDALQYAHDEGIVHRDIKPENVLLDRRGRVKIADFGLAKLVGTPQSGLSLTGTQQVMGTPHYMAPEQMERPAAVDHRADIYSLGVVFYELLTGELPLGRFAPPSKKAKVTADLDQVVLRTLEKEPEQRFQHASELKTAVETIPPQDAVDATTVPPVLDAPTIRLPFNIGDVYGGFAKAEGVLRFDGRQLHLQFRVKDEFVGVVSSGIKSVDIPIEDILAVECRSGWFSHTLEICTDRLDTLQDVPRSEAGRAKLQIAKRDDSTAEQLVYEINRVLGNERSVGMRPAVRQLAPGPYWREVDLSQIKREVRAPANGLLWLGILNCVAPFLLLLLLLVLLPASTIRSTPPQMRTSVNQSSPLIRVEYAEQPGDDGSFVEPPETSLPPAVEPPETSLPPATEFHRQANASVTFLAVFAVLYLAMVVPLAIIMILGSLRMKRLESYGLSVFASIVAFVPFHPLFLFGLPIGIWSLVVLGRRRTRVGFRQAGRLEDQGGWERDAPPKGEVGKIPKPLLSTNQQDALSRIRGPAIGIIVVGTINTAILLILIISVTFGGFGLFERLAIAVPSLIGLVQLRCGWAMYHARSFGMSMAGAIASVLPFSPTWMLGLAFGVWALIVLQRPDVKQLYEARQEY